MQLMLILWFQNWFAACSEPAGSFENRRCSRSAFSPSLHSPPHRPPKAAQRPPPRDTSTSVEKRANAVVDDVGADKKKSRRAPEGDELLQLLEVEVDDVVVALHDDVVGVFLGGRPVILVSARVEHRVRQDGRIRARRRNGAPGNWQIPESPVAVGAETGSVKHLKPAAADRRRIVQHGFPGDRTRRPCSPIQARRRQSRTPAAALACCGRRRRRARSRDATSRRASRPSNRRMALAGLFQPPRTISQSGPSPEMRRRPRCASLVARTRKLRWLCLLNVDLCGDDNIPASCSASLASPGIALAATRIFGVSREIPHMPFVDQSSLDRRVDVAGQQLHAIATTGESDKNGLLVTHRAPFAFRSFEASPTPRHAQTRRYAVALCRGASSSRRAGQNCLSAGSSAQAFHFARRSRYSDRWSARP